MGASIYAYWPGATEEEQGDHSDFGQDAHAYAWWQGEVAAGWLSRRWIKKNKLEALLSVHPLGTKDNEINWTTPQQLREAAIRLKEMLLAKERQALKLTRLYTKGPKIDEPHIELARDLDDLSWIAEYAEKRGAKVMTLLVGW